MKLCINILIMLCRCSFYSKQVQNVRTSKLCFMVNHFLNRKIYAKIFKIKESEDINLMIQFYS